AKREGFQRAAGTLVDRRYSDRGYDTPFRKQDPNLFTFVAYDEGKLVGTTGIRLDSALGLNADGLYKDELTVLREAGCKLCEFTRLAVDAAISKPVLARLFHTAYLYAGAVHGCTFMVIEVIPRHAPFYHRALGFEPIGAERLNPSVNARGVLLCVSFRTIADGLKRFGGKQREFPNEKSLFPYGFSPAEEAGILQRLKALDAEQHAV
ncbi:MAG: N-acyl amino acid synthase FeeM domain-containing protein, partial [Burkholderiales bacterium]